MNTMEHEIIRLLPETKEQAAQWFHEKWGIPKEAYLESMVECLKAENAVPQWYLAVSGEKIVGGLGVIENDFHDRKDLAPNICAVFVEEEHRRKGIAGKLLNFACADMKARGIDTLYLLTDHCSFYERYGWEFLCMAQGDGEEKMSRMYIHKQQESKGDSMFFDTDFLKSDEIELKVRNLSPADPVKGFVPAYHFDIVNKSGDIIGQCDLRLGHNEKLYYGGNIGYRVEEEYRGHGYAGKACRLLFELAKKHELGYVIITCDPDNIPSRRTCERLNGELLEIAELPPDNDMRLNAGSTEKCIFKFDL